MRRIIDGPQATPPEQRKAVSAVAQAVAKGRLVRPAECSRCGGTTRRIEAHHHKGYAPEHRLDVEWLCASCHAFETNTGKQKARRPIAQRRNNRKKPIRVDIEFLLDAVGGAR